MNPDKENTIDSTVAAEWTKKWRETYPDNCKAFLVPAVDLIQVLNEIGLLSDKAAKRAQKKANKQKKDIRAYMAIGADEGEKEEEKLLIVGTKRMPDPETKKEVYRDIIDGMIDGKPVKKMPLRSGSSGVFDFSHACPPACDKHSILN